MSTILSQVSYPVFLYFVYIFFIFASIFSFIVGVSFAFRNATMLRLFAFMNESYSLRKAMKPLDVPHFVEPVLLKHNAWLGFAILAGASASIYFLHDLDAAMFQPIFMGAFSYFTALAIAEYTRLFLLIGNGVCVALGILLLFFPHHLSSIEAYTDRWYTLRKQSRPLTQMHLGIDKWVLAHPTVFGATLSVMSMGLFISMFARI